jgi:hypothetical protein
MVRDDKQSMWRLALIVLLAGLLDGCSPSDPDAEARDRYRAAAKVAAEQIELPAGFTVVLIRVDLAETPKENRGAGQGGSAKLGSSLGSVGHAVGWRPGRWGR